jgi:hypothetical protein
MARRKRVVSAMLVAGVTIAAVACGKESSTCIDDMGIVISQFVSDGYNTAILNTGGGSGLSVNWTCPAGGTALITGTANTGTVSFDLTFTFNQCHDTTIENLTLTGVLRDQTQNGASTSSSRTETAHSDALTMTGHNAVCNADPINTTCVVDITPSNTTICGLTN